MIVASVGIGIIASLLFTEFVGLYAGGLIGPGYLALFLNQPLRIAMTIATALITYVFVSSLSKFIIMYGRRRFAAAVLIGYIVGWLVGTMPLGTWASDHNLRVVGYIVPGLIANDMLRQGVVKTMVSLSCVTVFVRLVLLIIEHW